MAEEVWHSGIKCKQIPLVRYDLEGAVAAETDPVELLVIGDAPTYIDNKKGNYWADKDGRELLKSIRAAGMRNFAILPAVRCYPGDQVDHFILDKKYRNERQDERKKALDLAYEALGTEKSPGCREYVTRARATFRPKMILAMGSLASEALGLGKNIKALRSEVLIPKKGLAAATRQEGTVVTWDRAYARVSRWAADEMFMDVDEKLPNLRQTGYLSGRGDERTIEIVELNTVDLVKRFVDRCLDPNNKAIKKSDFLCFDFETDGLAFSRERNRLINVGFAFRHDEDHAYVVPFEHPETPFSPDELVEVYGHMRRLFEGVGARFHAFLAHNAQFETGIVKAFFDVWIGEKGNKPILDSLILAYLHDENRHKVGIKKPYSLETLAREYIGFRWYEDSKMKSKRDRLIDEPLKVVNQYVGYDAAVTARLTNQIMDWMTDEGSLADLIGVAERIYGPATLYTVDMQMTGQEIDIDLLRKLRAKDSSIVHRLAEIREEFNNSPKVKKALAIINEKKGKGMGGMKALFSTSGTTATTRFDLNSPEHRKALFSGVCKLKGAETSVDKKFQEQYKDREPLVALFQEYQQLSKLDSAYLSPIAEYVQKSDDGRLHPSFNLTRTTSGRLSASDPNTQQVPRGDTKDKKQIKSLYTVPEGKVMVQLDFSQAEVRWLGILSGDKNLARRYQVAKDLKVALRENPNDPDLQKKVKIDGDLHMSTALDMYKLPRDLPFTDEKTAKLKRQAAKAVCFGLIYGKHYKSLARDLGIEENEALEAVEKWMGQFPWAAEWLDEVDEQIGKTCISKSPFGRWRRLPEAAASDISVANRAKRQARNTPIQSAASDFCIYAACKLRQALREHPDPRLREGAKLINTVHDSLGAEVPADPDVLLEYMRLSSSIFTDPHLIEKDFGIVTTVPLEVDYDVGLNWGNVVGCEINREEVEAAIFNAEVLRRQPPGTLLSELKGKGLLYEEQ